MQFLNAFCVRMDLQLGDFWGGEPATGGVARVRRVVVLYKTTPLTPPVGLWPLASPMIHRELVIDQPRFDNDGVSGGGYGYGYPPFGMQFV